MTKFPERKWLSNFDILNPVTATSSGSTLSPDTYQMFLNQALDEAQSVLQHNLKKIKKLQQSESSTQTDHSLAQAEALRWFILPSDFPGSLPLVPEKGTPYLAHQLRGTYPLCLIACVR
jgi:hypothetical protein